MSTSNDVRSMQELLPWLAPLTEGLVVCKDSSFLATFEFQGADADSVGDGEVFQVAQAAERMLFSLRDMPVTLWWTVRRERTTDYPGEPMPDPVSQMLDDEQRANFHAGAAFINRHFLSVLWMPERSTSGMFAKIGALMADGASMPTAIKTAVQSTYFGKTAFAWKAAELDRAVADFEAKLDQVGNILAAIHARRLVGQEFMGFLWAQANPGTQMVPKVWNGTSFFDAYLPEQPLTVHRDILQFGDGGNAGADRHVAAVSMKSWPTPIAFGAFNSLLSLPCEMVVSHCFRLMNADAALKHIDNVKRTNDMLKYPLKAWLMAAIQKRDEVSEKNIDPSRAIAAADATEAKGMLNGGHLLFGYHTLGVALVAPTAAEVEERTRQVVRMFHSSPFVGAVRESMGLLSAWATTLPGQWQESRRWLTLSSANVVDIAPLMGVGQGHRMNAHLTAQLGQPCQALTVLATDYNTPFYFNFHVGALGHAMVIGPTRVGKSLGMNFLISQFRKYGQAARVLIFDKDHSCRIPTLLQGGDHVDLRPGGRVRINPMAMSTDRNTWPFLVRWLEGLISSRGYVVTAEDSKEIAFAVEAVAGNPDPAMRHLYTVRTMLSTGLGLHLDEWVGTGPLAPYFDNADDSFALSSFTCIEMGEVMREPRVARAFMDYAFFRLQQALEAQRHGNAEVTLVYVEECWFMLADEYFAARIKDWLKTFAKLNAFLVMTTQSIEDMADVSPTVFASIRDNIATKIFLPNPNALTETLSAFYRKNFDLRPDLVERIATAIPRQDYIIVQPEISRKVRMALSRRQVAALRSDMAAQRVFERIYGARPPGWQAQYINEVMKV